MNSLDVITFGEAMAMFMAEQPDRCMRLSIIRKNWPEQKQM